MFSGVIERDQLFVVVLILTSHELDKNLISTGLIKTLSPIFYIV